ncbi:MAG: protein-tyrosine phosphatase family protein, partial [bacterium]
IKIDWIITDGDGALGIKPKPRGGDMLAEELYALREMGVDVIVSLLTEGECRELELSDEKEISQQYGMEFISFPIPDRQHPTDMLGYLRLIKILVDRLHQGQKIIIHCRTGIGRASLVAAGVLVLQGIPVDDAFARISAAKRCPVPDTDTQRQWLGDFARQYRQIERDSELVERLSSMENDDDH